MSDILRADSSERDDFAGNSTLDPEVSIIMPCLNESETLETCIRKAQNFLQQHGVRGEVVIGDNGSTDGSQDIARRCGARVVDVPLRGYGAALFYASLAAHGQYLIMGDSDDSYDFTNLMPFVDKLREGYELVMGNRFVGGIKGGAMPWKNRYIGNPILSGIGRMFFHCPARDFHCGLRGFSATAFRKMDLRTTGMEYASEMVIKSTLMGLKITEVPTTLWPDGRTRPPHLKPWRDGWRHLRFMLIYSPRWLFLYPGYFLILTGIAAMIWLLPGPRTVGTVTFDVHSLLYAAVAILLGVQAITFAVFSKIFAMNEGLVQPLSRLNTLFKYVQMEHVVVAGLLLILLGLGGSLYSLAIWQRAGFGPLDPSRTFRYAIPSVLCLALGTQAVFASFFLSILGMKIRKLGPASG